jgi:predicted permease
MSNRFLNKLMFLLRRGRFQRELDEEMAFHRTQAEREFAAEGMTAEAAHTAAMRQFGNAAKLRDQSHEVVGFRLEAVAQDVRFALRQLRKNPGFAATAILILALGIGVSVAIFAFVDAALIKPLPYPEPTRLVAVNSSTDLFPRNNLSYPDYVDWKRMNTVFSSMDVFAANRFEWNTPSGAEPVHGLKVSTGFLGTLRIKPMLGRDFHAGEDAAGASPVVMLRYGIWQRRFGGRRDVMGQAVNLSGVAYTIVGVLPKEFEFAPREIAEFLVPMQPTSECEQRRSCHDIDAVARLKDGVSVASALAQMKAIAAQLERQYPDSNRGYSAAVTPMSEAIVGNIKPILLVLLGGACLLLVIACVNVSSLMLVRAESRRREVAVRGALGASRARLSAQFVTEALTLVAAGNVAGLALAYAGMKGLSGLISTDWAAGMPFLRSLGLNARVLMFAACLSVLAGILFSLTPILHFRLSKMRDGLADGGRGSAGMMWRRMGANLVVIELATAVVLLAGAGLLGKSLYKLLHENLGFRADHLATVNVHVPEKIAPKPEQQLAFERAVVARAAALPGVESAAAMDVLPVSCNCNTDWVRFVGKPYNGIHNEVNDREVTAGTFRTLQVKLKAGRFFTEQDTANTPKVVLVNEAFVRKFLPGEDPVGKRMGDTALTPTSLRQIIGVVEDFKEAGLDQDQWPAEYEAFSQNPSNYFSVVLRTSQDAGSILPQLAPMIHGVNPNVSVDWQRTMEDRIDDSDAAYIHRSAAYLMGGFSAMALVLGVVGLYGVISYSASQRTREIGVRMALGAQRSSVYRLILSEAGRLIAIGVVVGIAGAVGSGVLMRKLLFGVQAWDAGTLVGVAAVLGIVALLASYIPARRAAMVNPSEALRAE